MSKVLVSASRFRSLLTNRNLSLVDLAEKVDAKADLALLAVEDQEIDFDDVEKIAALISRPWAYLLVDEAERAPDHGQDNRTFENRRASLSTSLLEQLESASRLLDDSLDLFPSDKAQVPLVTNNLPSGAVAVRMRQFLGVDLEAQLEVKDEWAALRLWVDALHARAIYVLQRPLDDPSVRAFSMVRRDHALVVVSTKDTAYARAFSAIHEYTHVALRSAGVCDLDDHSAVERFCNQVSAEVLVPTALLALVVGEEGAFTGEEDEDDKRLQRMSRRLRVSQAALLIRLRDAGRLDQESYDALEARRSARRGKRTSGGSYYGPAINRVGRRFARNVVDAWDEGVLSRREASTLLDVGEHNFEPLRSALLQGEEGSG